MTSSNRYRFEIGRQRKGPSFRREARPFETSSRLWLATTLERGSVSPAATGASRSRPATEEGRRLPAVCRRPARGEPWLPGTGAAGGLVCCSAAARDIPAPAGDRAVVAVRPSEAATDADPMPGTVGSIKLARSRPTDRAGVAPEVRLTSRGAVSGRRSRLVRPTRARSLSATGTGGWPPECAGQPSWDAVPAGPRGRADSAEASGSPTPGGAFSSIGSGLSGPTGGLGICGPSGRMWNCLWAS